MRDLIARIESYEFECEAGNLRQCVDWQKLVAACFEPRGEIVAALRAELETMRDWSVHDIGERRGMERAIRTVEEVAI